MKCVDQLSKCTGIYTESIPDPMHVTPMVQSMFRDRDIDYPDENLTYMVQDMFNERKQPLTNMSQRMFNIGSNSINDDESNN